jgi:hypothetical protein
MASASILTCLSPRLLLEEQGFSKSGINLSRLQTFFGRHVEFITTGQELVCERTISLIFRN